MIKSGHTVIGVDGSEWTVGVFCNLPTDMPGCKRVHAIMVAGPTGPRLVREQGDGPHVDLGDAPFNDASRHPFLPDHLAEGVEVARRVGSAIPGWRNTEFGIYGIKESDDNPKLEGLTMHNAENGRGGWTIASDHYVDSIPHSRFVDRLALLFAEHLQIEPHDDGSGYPGEFNMDIQPDRTFVTYSDDEGGSVVIASTGHPDGSWSHTLTIETVEQLDPVDHIRSARDGYVQRAADAIEEQACFAGQKVDRAALRVVSVEETDATETHKTHFHIDPASVRFLR